MNKTDFKYIVDIGFIAPKFRRNREHDTLSFNVVYTALFSDLRIIAAALHLFLLVAIDAIDISKTRKYDIKRKIAVRR